MKEFLKHTFFTISVFAIALIVIGLVRKAQAQTLDTYYQEQGFTSEQVAQMQHKASLEWQKENGEYQPNLTPETETYLRNYTALLQEGMNNGKP